MNAETHVQQAFDKRVECTFREHGYFHVLEIKAAKDTYKLFLQGDREYRIAAAYAVLKGAQELLESCFEITTEGDES